jgi:hypothetical protein
VSCKVVHVVQLKFPVLEGSLNGGHGGGGSMSFIGL